MLAAAFAGCSPRPAEPVPPAPARAKAADPRGCGPDPGHACSASEYCDYEPGRCGQDGKSGQCQRRPRMCPRLYAPVCGCDGRIYPNECDAHLGGSDLDQEGRCSARLPDWIPCGGRYCNAQTSYCELVRAPVRASTCKPLPAACTPGADCACFPADTRCRGSCTVVETDGVAGFRLTCKE